MVSLSSSVLRLSYGFVGLAIVSFGWSSAVASDPGGASTAPTIPAAKADSEALGIANDLLSNPLGKPFNWEAADYARLRALGPKAAGVVPILIPRANDPDPAIRSHALSALAAVRSPAAIPTLIAALQDPSPNLTIIAKGGLIDLGPSAVPALEKALNSADARAWKPSLMTLSEIDPEGYAVLARAAASHRDLSLRTEANRLASLMIPALVERLHGKVSSARNSAAQLLMLKGPPAMRSLLHLLNDPDPFTRRAAGDAIGRQLASAGKSPAARAAMAAYAGDIAAALSNPDPAIGNTLGEGLSQFPEGHDALAAAASASDPRARAAATRWLGSKPPVRAGWNANTRPASTEIATLVKALSDPDAQVRVAAVQALEQTHDPSAIDPLTRTMLDADPDVRLAAGGALVTMGSQASDGLASGLKNPDPAIRMQSAQTLGELGPAVAAAVLPLFSDQNVDVRRAATTALYLALTRRRSLGPPSPAQRESIRLHHAALRELLNDPDPQTQTAAAMLLQIGGVAGAEDLARLLGSSDPNQRRSALEGLLRMPSEQLGTAVEPLADVARDDPANRSAAAQVLVIIGPSASARIFELLSSPDPAVRGAMQSALAGRATSVELLRKMLRDSHPQVRAALLDLIPAFDVREEMALLDAIKDADPRFRAAAVGPLGGDRSSLARAALREAARDTDPAIRAAAASVLDQLTEKDLLGALAHDPFPAVRAAAITRLADTRTNDPMSLLPVFLTALQDSDDAVRAAGAGGLGKMYATLRNDPRKPKIPPELTSAVENAIRDKTNGVCAAALKLLRHDPAGAEAFLSTMLATIKDPADPQRPAVLPVLALLARDHPPALSALLTALTDHDDALREAAASAFVILNESSLATLPAERNEARKHLAELAAATSDANPRVRIAAALALLAIQPGHPAAAPALVRALRDSDAAVRLAAMDSAWRIPLQTPGMRPALLTALNDPDPGMLSALVQALSMRTGLAGQTSGGVLAPLGLMNPDAATRRATAETLGAAGAASLDSAGRLLQAASADPDSDVRRAAAAALKKILTAAVQAYAAP